MVSVSRQSLAIGNCRRAQGETMFRSVVAILTFIGCSLASAQSAKDLVGTYTFVSEIRMKDGVETKSPRNGRLVLDANGNYVLTTIRPGLPKVASNNRMTATSEENKAIVSGTLTHFGTYTVEGNALVFKVNSASFPNWNGAVQKRPFTLVGDELTYSLAAASGGGSVRLTWKRVR